MVVIGRQNLCSLHGIQYIPGIMHSVDTYQDWY